MRSNEAIKGRREVDDIDVHDALLHRALLPPGLCYPSVYGVIRGREYRFEYYQVSVWVSGGT